MAAQTGAALVAIENLTGRVRVVSFAVPLAAALLLVGSDRLLTVWTERRRARHLGPYRLLELIGEGGMGAVWRARHLVSRREVALKVLQPHRTADRTADEAHRLRFLREGAILARLDHPNIVRVYETGESDGRGYIAMERLAGDTLGARIRSGGPLPPAGATALLAVAAEALGAAHRAGIVHRDVKADNFFVVGAEADLPLSLEGWRTRLKLMDFGLAHSQEMLALTAGDGLLGTLAYLAPEQLGGQAPNFRSDLYALGVVAFEAATGRLPASPDNPLATLPEPLARLLARLLDRDPAARPASAADVAEAAVALLQETEGTAPEAPPRTAPGSPAEGTPSSTERLWQGRFREVRRSLDAGSVTEAQILLLALIADLRRRLEILPPDERSTYARHHRLHEVLDLERRLRTDPQESR